MMLARILTLLIAVAVLNLVEGAGDDSTHHELNYAEQDEWPETENKKCGGKMQSPIDICSTDVATNMVKVKLVNYNTSRQFEVENNGHADVVRILNPPADGQLPQIKFKNNTFILVQFHFHWGSNDSTGSEHLIDNQQYVLEMHMVHRNSKYNSLNDALGQKLGVVVLATLFQLGKTHPYLVPLTDAHNEVADVEGHPVTVEKEFALQQLMPDGATDQLYMYTGSLTTPPCTEQVQWLVGNKINSLSKAQIAQFRQLRRDDNMPVSPNYRYPQPLNNRKVSRNFEP
ncbi:Carbonic anhydrase 1 [Halotydeus destructor]|nr:Carbonic anhydrase 1 [Halotydeus destructor]